MQDKYYSSKSKNISECVRCGACLAVCPVYKVTRNERFSPRGKGQILENLLFLKSDEKEGLGAGKIVDTLGACLQCGACTNTCQVGVDIKERIRVAREEDGKKFGLPFLLDRAFKSKRVLPLIQRVIKTIPGTSGLIMRLATAVDSWHADDDFVTFILSSLSAQPALSRPLFRGVDDPGSSSPSGKGPKIGLFIGCIQNYLFPDVAESIVNWFGGSLYVPLGQMCCGLPAWSSGARQVARETARENIRIFDKAELDYILTGCASCSSMIRNSWPRLFTEDEPEYAMALELSGKIREFSELVDELGMFPVSDMEPHGVSATLHIPCHQRYGLGSAGSLIKVMKRIAKGINVLESGCCGQGGTFGLKYRQMSGRILSKGIEAWKRDGSPQIVVTTCSGCILQWKMGVADLPGGPMIIHPAQYIEIVRDGKVS